MNISLVNNLTRNRKCSHRTFLVEQNHQPVCTICNEQVGVNIICCRKCHCKIQYKCSFFPSQQLYRFVERKRKYTCVNCTPANVSNITPGIVNIKTNELTDNVNEIEGINTLLRKENQQLREKKTLIKNSNKVDKASSTYTLINSPLIY